MEETSLNHRCTPSGGLSEYRMSSHHLPQPAYQSRRQPYVSTSACSGHLELSPYSLLVWTVMQ